ncbi:MULTISPECIES: glutamyl-tRNA reductase [unclassified Ornithinimicrobium]|uniref:glutamyl-tRNA reductase n=1 Tax=unclassified Ornithinimicrobium TaxID=2615080 RepID=UPI0038530E6A
MSVLVVGMSHHSAPIELLERAALTPGAARELGARLQAGDHVEETLVLSTCNRLEVVVEAGTFHGALSEVGDALGELTGLSQEELTSHLYVHYDDRAVSHLFEVACGLDSLAVGESEILGQLREALAAAQREGRLGVSLNPLLQQALRVGKRAHAETAIDRVSRSLVGLGLDRATTVHPDLSTVRAVVVGAGAMSGLAVARLVRAGVADVTVVNRTRARALRLAENHQVVAGDWADLERLVGGADLVLACTGAVGHVVEHDALAAARAATGRTGAPLVLLDLALPRDVDPAVTDLPGVHLWGLGDLHSSLEAVVASGAATSPEEGLLPRPVAGAVPHRAVAEVRDLVTSEVAAYLTERRAARLGPTLAALRASASKVVDAEMARLDQRVPHLPEDERVEVRRTVQRVVDKLLHTPSVRAKELVSSGDTDLAHALRELFDLDPHEVVVTTRPPLTLPTAGGEA